MLGTIKSALTQGQERNISNYLSNNMVQGRRNPIKKVLLVSVGLFAGWCIYNSATNPTNQEDTHRAAQKWIYQGNINLSEGEKLPNHQHSRNYFHKAVTDYTHASRLAPNNRSIYVGRGLAYQYLDDRPNALKDYTQAIMLDREAPEVYFNRGLLHQKMDNIPAAIADCQKAAALFKKLHREEEYQAAMQLLEYLNVPPESAPV
jgi:tetratricopeptide (TPR) repeat protein